jgi:deoxyribodipyrimidine photolyase-related protein
MNNVYVVLGNQLFEPNLLINLGCEHVFMSEDFQLCRYERHHKLKLYLFLTAMREYKDELEDSGISVHYSKLNDRDESESYLSHLESFLINNNINQVNLFEIEDKPFEKELLRWHR